MLAAIPIPEVLGSVPPLSLQQLVGDLRSVDAPKVRTSLVELSPTAVLLGHSWATLLELEVVHIGKVVAAQARTDGAPDAGIYRAADILMYIRRILPPAERHAPPPGGVWLCGLDLLLAKLPEPQRALCWRGLRDELPYLPPLIVVLPAALAARFGPAPDTWPTRWLAL
jgi:hypothetical protein